MAPRADHYEELHTLSCYGMKQPLFRSPIGTTPSFPALKNLSIVDGHLHPGFLESLAIPQVLPALRSLHIDIAREFDHTVGGRVLPSSSLSALGEQLHHLSVVGSDGSTALDVLLAKCPNLRSLAVTGPHPIWKPFAGDPIKAIMPNNRGAQALLKSSLAVKLIDSRTVVFHSGREEDGGEALREYANGLGLRLEFSDGLAQGSWESWGSDRHLKVFDLARWVDEEYERQWHWRDYVV